MVRIYFAGIDLGSTMTKIVVLDEDGQVIASVVNHTGAEHRRLANRVMEEALLKTGLSIEDISFIMATGYGRINVPFADRQITELTCHRWCRECGGMGVEQARAGCQGAQDKERKARRLRDE